MKRLTPMLIAALLLCFTLCTSPASADLITFDIFGPTYAGPVEADFTMGDARFSGWSLLYDSLTRNYLLTDFAYGSPQTTMATISFDEPVYLTGFNCFSSGVTCILSRHGVPVTGGGFLSQTTPWNFFDGSRARVDEVSFQLPNTPGMAMAALNIDNVAYSPVPIPGVVWLLGSALFGIMGLRKHFMN